GAHGIGYGVHRSLLELDGRERGRTRCRHPVRGHGSTSAVAKVRIPSLAADPMRGCCCNAPRERADFTETGRSCESCVFLATFRKSAILQMVTLRPERLGLRDHYLLSEYGILCAMPPNDQTSHATNLSPGLDEAHAPRPSHRRWPWIAAVVVLALVAAGVWSWWPAAPGQPAQAARGRADQAGRALPVVAAPARKG